VAAARSIVGLLQGGRLAGCDNDRRRRRRRRRRLGRRRRQSAGVVVAAPPRTLPGLRDEKEGASSGDNNDSRCQRNNAITTRVTALVQQWQQCERNGQTTMTPGHGRIALMPAQWMMSVQRE
jgi:hypothetical protein